jgi:aspartokinase
MTVISTLYVEEMKKITQLAKRVVTKNDLQNFIDHKMNMCINTIYLDIGTAISNIQEAKKFLFSICKYVATILLKTSQEKMNAKSEHKEETTHVLSPALPPTTQTTASISSNPNPTPQLPSKN